MKKKSFTTAFLFVLVLSSALLVSHANANWMIMTSPSPPQEPEVLVLLPKPDRTYSTNIGVDFVVVGRNWAYLRNYIKTPSISYSLDDKPYVALVCQQVTAYNSRDLIFHFWGNLNNLSDGVHSLEFYADCEGKYSSQPYKLEDFKTNATSQKISFKVDSQISDNVLPKVTINSPRDEVYNTTDIALVFTVNEQCAQIHYSIDGQNSVAITDNTTIPVVQDGTHSLSIIACDLAGNMQSTVTAFTVAAPPKITIISPKNQGYDTTNLTLTILSDEPLYRIMYELDNETCSIFGNTTLANLTSGLHSIVVYASDKSGNIGYSETIEFTIAESFPTTLLAAASLGAVAIVGIGVFCYRKKHS